MSVLIPLSQGYEAIVDDVDADFILQRKWYAKIRTYKDGRITIYAVRCATKTDITSGAILMHRDLMCPEAGQFVDHIDHNGLNNQRSNLRLATPRQNKIHRFESKNQHGFLGVWKRGNRFRARIDINGESIYSSISYATVEEAALARDALSLKHFGEFALLNFPQKTQPIAMHEDLAKGPPVCRSSASPKTERSEAHRATDELMPAKPDTVPTSMSVALCLSVGRSSDR